MNQKNILVVLTLMLIVLASLSITVPNASARRSWRRHSDREFRYRSTPAPTPEPDPTPTPEPEPTPAPSEPPVQPQSTFLGLSGYVDSTSGIDAIIHLMNQEHLNLFRLSFNPEWLNGPHPYHASYVQYFLDHCDYTIIVDRNHLYPPTDTSAQTARNNWNTVKTSLFDVLARWPNNPRVMVELVNEYVASDYNTRMQDLITSIRHAGYTNGIVVNKWNTAWHKFEDPLDNTYQGYHYYFNTWSVTGATDQLNIALSRGIKVINTEIGADYHEDRSFTTGTVAELEAFMQWCYDHGIGNTVWMYENLHNWSYYQQLNFNLPS
jgi:hypothetical protein